MNIQEILYDIVSKISLDKTYGGRDAPYIALSNDVGLQEDASLIGTLNVLIKRRTGEIAIIHAQSLTGIKDEKELKNNIAEALSSVLSQHHKWPR